MQQERQGEIDHEVSMEENAGPLLITKLEVLEEYSAITYILILFKKL